jgi:hypothetical protein
MTMIVFIAVNDHGTVFAVALTHVALRKVMEEKYKNIEHYSVHQRELSLTGLEL